MVLRQRPRERPHDCDWQRREARLSHISFDVALLYLSTDSVDKYHFKLLEDILTVLIGLETRLLLQSTM